MSFKGAVGAGGLKPAAMFASRSSRAGQGEGRRTEGAMIGREESREEGILRGGQRGSLCLPFCWKTTALLLWCDLKREGNVRATKLPRASHWSLLQGRNFGYQSSSDQRFGRVKEIADWKRRQ